MPTPTPDNPESSELRMLARFREDLTGPSDDTIGRMRHTVLNTTLYQSNPAHGAGGRGTRGWLGRRTLVGSGAALTVAGVVAGVVIAGASGPDGARPAAAPGAQAQAVFRLAAQRVAVTPAASAQQGRYAYIRTESTHIINNQAVADGDTKTSPGTHPMVGIRVRGWHETWLDPQGMLAVRSRGVDGMDPQPLTPRDRGPATAMGLLAAPPNRYDVSITDNRRDTIDEQYATGKAELKADGPSLARPTPEFLAGLPTDPDRLLAVLRTAAATADASGSVRTSEAGVPRNVEVFEEIARLFSADDPIIPSDLRAALYRVAAALPGIRRVPGEVTVAGHRAISVAIQAKGTVQMEILLDPDTYQFVGDRISVGQVDEHWTVVTASGLVDSVRKAG